MMEMTVGQVVAVLQKMPQDAGVAYIHPLFGVPMRIEAIEDLPAWARDGAESRMVCMGVEASFVRRKPVDPVPYEVGGMPFAVTGAGTEEDPLRLEPRRGKREER